MSTAPIRTAVLGYGLAGRVFHCPFVNAVPGLELSVIVVSNPDRAAAAHAAYPNARIVATPDEAFADPTIDLIVIGTPNDTHVDLVTRALNAGKHVVCDKPLATSAADTLTLIALARQQGKLLAPFHNRRYDTEFLTLRKLVDEQTLGRITQIIAHYDRYRPLVRPNTWKETGGHGNGLLYDLGPHVVDQAVALYGKPSFITASVRHDRDVTGIEDAFDIALDFEVPTAPGEPAGRNLRYECSASMLAADPAPRFRVHGTLGSYVKQGLDPQEAALLGGARPPQLGSQQPWLPESQTAWGTLTLATKRTEPVALDRKPFPSVTGDYRVFYANVRDAIHGTTPLAIPPEDGYRVIRLLDLAQQSSDEQRTLPVTFEL
jgi:scyllo-inositol 2-dehydrogenase (NADP+)